MFTTTNPEHALIVTDLKNALVALPIGGTLTYPQARKVAGRDVHRTSRHLLAKAREEAEKELGCIFEAVRNIGYMRMPTDASVNVGLHAVRRIRSASRRGSRRLSRLNSNSLSDANRKRSIAYQSMLNAVAMLADGNKARTLAACADPAKPIPPADVLGMFV